MTDPDIAQNLRIGAELDVVADCRRSILVTPVADGDTLTQRDVPAQPCRRMKENVSEMMDAYVPARSMRSSGRQMPWRSRSGETAASKSSATWISAARLAGKRARPEPIDPDRPDRLLPDERAARIAGKIGLEIWVVGHRSAEMSCGGFVAVAAALISHRREGSLAVCALVNGPNSGQQALLQLCGFAVDIEVLLDRGPGGVGQPQSQGVVVDQCEDRVAQRLGVGRAHQ